MTYARRRDGGAGSVRFELHEPIGQGRYGTIHRCTIAPSYRRVLHAQGVCPHLVDGVFAVKVQQHDTYFWDNFSVLREIDALMRTRAFPGTVDVHDCTFDANFGRRGVAASGCSYIVLEHYDGTLLQYIQQTRFEQRSRHLPFVFTQMLLTMAYLDYHGIAHRDVKPSNILVRSLLHRSSTGDVNGGESGSGGGSGGASNDGSGCSDCGSSSALCGNCHEVPHDCLAMFAPFCPDVIAESQASPPLPPPPPRTSGAVRSDQRAGIFRMDEEDDDDDEDDADPDPFPGFRRRRSSRGDTNSVASSNGATEQRPHSLPSERVFLTSSNAIERATSEVSDHDCALNDDTDHQQDAAAALHRYYAQSNPLTNSTSTQWRESSDAAGDLAVIDNVPHVVLCDFGLAKQLVPANDTPCLVTLNFRPPELFSDQNHTYCTNVDIWSLGCILVQCLTGSILFRGRDPNTVYDSIMKLLGSASAAVTSDDVVYQRMASVREHLIRAVGARRLASVPDCDELLHLIALMLDLNPDTRPSARSLLTHPYVRPYVRRVICFMCSRRVRPMFGASRVLDGALAATARWAFRIGVDVNTHVLDPDLGLGRCKRKEVHRDLICQWMWQRNFELGTPIGMVLSAIHNFDRFMSYASIDTLALVADDSMYSLAAIVCFYLTIHYYEAYQVRIESLIATCGFAYAPHVVHSMISTVLHALHFQVSTPSHWTLYTRHRTLMRMSVTDAAEQRVVDDHVLRLVYNMVRSVRYATAPQAMVLTMAVERVRFTRRFLRAHGEAYRNLQPPRRAQPDCEAMDCADDGDDD